MRLRSSGLRLFTLVAVCVVLRLTALGQVDVRNWPQVHLGVIAIDKSGHLVPDLQNTTLGLREDGRTSIVGTVEPTIGPQSVCILVDTSSSAKGSLPLVKTAVLRMLQNLPAQDEVCLATFDVKPGLLQKLTMTRDQFPSLVAEMRAGGGTALYDSLTFIGAEMVKNARNPDQAIVLISDGDDNYSRTSEAMFLSQQEKSGGPVVYMIRVPMKNHLDVTKRSVPAYVLALGGLTIFPESLSDLDRSVDQVLEVMKNRYSLTYVSPEPKRNGRIRHIKIDVQGQDKIAVHAPEGYYAPSQ